MGTHKHRENRQISEAMLLESCHGPLGYMVQWHHGIDTAYV